MLEYAIGQDVVKQREVWRCGRALGQGGLLAIQCGPVIAGSWSGYGIQGLAFQCGGYTLLDQWCEDVEGETVLGEVGLYGAEPGCCQVARQHSTEVKRLPCI